MKTVLVHVIACHQPGAIIKLPISSQLSQQSQAFRYEIALSRRAVFLWNKVKLPKNLAIIDIYTLSITVVVEVLL